MGRAVAEKRKAFGNGYREKIGLPMIDTGQKNGGLIEKNGGLAMGRAI